MNKLFPTIPIGAPVPCFNCNRPATGAPENDATRGSGQWRAYCAQCDMFTFFDRPAAWSALCAHVIPAGARPLARHSNLAPWSITTAGLNGPHSRRSWIRLL